MDDRTVAHLLAALRYCQEHAGEIDFACMEHFVSTPPDEECMAPLSDEAVDALCEDINTGRLDFYDPAREEAKAHTDCRMGRVVLNLDYVVDLDNKEMVEHAKQCMYEDLMNAVKYDELHTWLDVVDAPDTCPDDIPEFLQEDVEDE